MIRVTNNLSAKKRHKKIINLSKGYKGSLSKLFISANQTVIKALKYSYEGRKNKKRAYVKLWTNRINAKCKNKELTYKSLKENLNKRNINLNRKIISKIFTIDNEMMDKIISIN